MLFELRQYTCRPGKRDEWVRLMDEEIIPMQTEAGMVIAGSFIAEDDPDQYIWIRRFENEAERVRLYEAVYQSPRWKEEFAPRIPDYIDRELIKVRRMIATPRSGIQ